MPNAVPRAGLFAAIHVTSTHFLQISDLASAWTVAWIRQRKNLTDLYPGKHMCYANDQSTPRASSCPPPFNIRVLCSSFLFSYFYFQL